jgi:poly(beta-D-mannuronate) lyase
MTIYNITFDKLNLLQSKLQPGDSVLIKDGEYKNQNIKLSSNGNFVNNIIIKPKNKGKVILTGKFYLLIDGSYITFKNFILKNGGIKDGVKIKGVGNRITGCEISYDCDGPVLSIYDKYNRIDNCKIYKDRKFNTCVKIKTCISNYILIDHNIFKNINIQIETLNNYQLNARILLVENIFENIDNVYIRTTKNIVYKNIFIKTRELNIRYGNNSIIAKNLFLSTTGGISISGENHIIYGNFFKGITGCKTKNACISILNGKKMDKKYIQVKNLKVYKNIFIDNDVDIVIGVPKNEGKLLPLNCNFKENLIYKISNNPVFGYKGQGAENLKFLDNKYYANNMGNNPVNSGELIDNKQFSLKDFKININIFNYDNMEINIEKLYKNKNKKIEINIYYYKIKKEILEEITSLKNI